MKLLSFWFWFLFQATLALSAPVTEQIKIDHFGYRLTDTKIAYFTQDPGNFIEIRNSHHHSLVLKISKKDILDAGQDKNTPPISGDHVWWVNFSNLTEPGYYYIYSPKFNYQSYVFKIEDDVYNSAVTAVTKSFYYQRCGCPKPIKCAGPWFDEKACHLSDKIAPADCNIGESYGKKDYGTLDLSGGWHDAGDFEKKLGNSTECNHTNYGDRGNSLWYLLTAYENNERFFKNFSVSLPESGNGVPDILNQCKWELDFYLKLQRPDNHVISSLYVKNLGMFQSPPSEDTNPRFYGPPTFESEEIFVACLAHAARIYASVPACESYAEKLRKAALKTWKDWVVKAPSSDHKFWAAAEIFQTDPSQKEADNFIQNYQDWSHLLKYRQVLCYGVYTYLQSSNASPSIKENMRHYIGSTIDDCFNENDNYNSGMTRDYYSWNSNWNKADHGLTLLWGARLNATGSHAKEECVRHAEDYLHYINGANPLNMLYMTNTESFGGKHCVWHLFHVWFGYYQSSYSKSNFIGKPSSITDPLYPYFIGTDSYGINDDDTSTYGPPPGFIVGGPTYQYYDLGGKAIGINGETNNVPCAKIYRDWNFVGSKYNETQPWIVQEGGIYENASYLALASAFTNNMTSIQSN